MKILAVDLGNFNVKTSENIIFKSIYTTNEQLSDEDEEVIVYDDIKYFMGKGNFDFEYNKTQKNYLPFLLYAIALSTDESAIDLVIGCPISQFQLKDVYKDDLEGKTFRFYYNGESRKIFINRLAVIPEGVSSFYTLSDSKRKNNDILIIDIGGRTVNVSSFIKGKKDKTITFPTGMLNLYSTIFNRINVDGSYTIDKVERFINEGRITGTDKENNQFIKSIFNDLKLYIPNLTHYDVYFTGGGSKVLDNTIAKYSKANFNIMENPLFSNVIGNYNIAKAKWR